MTQTAELELPESEARKHSLGECTPLHSISGMLCGALRRTERSEARLPLSAPVWLTSLRKPGVFEVVPTENVSTLGIRLVAQQFWEPAELVLVSSPPGLCVQGSVVYCKKLPSDDHILGIQFDAPIERWMEALEFRESQQP
jgi:hypothetical protein